MPLPLEENILFFKLSAVTLYTGGFEGSSKRCTFPDFLYKKKHDVFHLFFKRLCCSCVPHAHNRQYEQVRSTYQWELLYVKNRARKCSNRENNSAAYMT